MDRSQFIRELDISSNTSSFNDPTERREGGKEGGRERERAREHLIKRFECPNQQGAVSRVRKPGSLPPPSVCSFTSAAAAAAAMR